MRAQKMNGYIGELRSSFLSCEKDTEAIIKKLFVESNPYSDDLKRLLVINTPDCLRDKTNQTYINKLKSISVSDLNEKGYVRLNPRVEMKEHEDIKSFIIITFDNFTPNGNDYYRDCMLTIDVICHNNYWDLGNFQQRPLKICGIIDGILNGTKLSGIGSLNFLGATELVLNEELSGYCLTYAATHGNDDNIPEEEE